MLRTLVLAAGLLAASGPTLAYDDPGYRHGRVISVEPHVVISFGNRHHDGTRILYESGSHPVWTSNSHYRPTPVIILPPRYVKTVHLHRHHDWDDRHDWRHDRCDHRRHGHDD
jgi:hypothetical protein